MRQMINSIAPEDTVLALKTALALKLVARTRALLDGGRRWKADELACGRLGFTCDPLSSRAHYFNLVGAATRAQWELRDELAAVDEDENLILDLLKVMCSSPTTPYSGELGWRYVDSILTGLEGVLLEYQEGEWKHWPAALCA